MKNLGPVHFRLSGQIEAAQTYLQLGRTLHGITKVINGRLPNEPLAIPSADGENLAIPQLIHDIFGDLANNLVYDGVRWDTRRGWDKQMFQIQDGPLFAGPDHQHTWRFMNQHQQTVTITCLASLDIDRVNIHVTSPEEFPALEEDEDCKPYFWAGLRWKNGYQGIGDDPREFQYSGISLHLYEPWPDADHGLCAPIDWDNSNQDYQQPIEILPYPLMWNPDTEHTGAYPGNCVVWYNGLGHKTGDGCGCGQCPAEWYNWQIYPFGARIGAWGIGYSDQYYLDGPEWSGPFLGEVSPFGASPTILWAGQAQRSRYGAYWLPPFLARDPQDDTQNWTYSIHVDPEDPPKTETGGYPHSNPGFAVDWGYVRPPEFRLSLNGIVWEWENRYGDEILNPPTSWACPAKVLNGKYILRVSAWRYTRCLPAVPLNAELMIRIGKGKCQKTYTYSFEVTQGEPAYRAFLPGGLQETYGGFLPPDAERECMGPPCWGDGLKAGWYPIYWEIDIKNGSIEERHGYEPAAWFTGSESDLEKCLNCCEGEYEAEGIEVAPPAPTPGLSGIYEGYGGGGYAIDVMNPTGLLRPMLMYYGATVTKVQQYFDYSEAGIVYSGYDVCEVVLDCQCTDGIDETKVNQTASSLEPWGNATLKAARGYVAVVQERIAETGYVGICIQSATTQEERCFLNVNYSRTNYSFTVGQRVLCMPVFVYPASTYLKVIPYPWPDEDYRSGFFDLYLERLYLCPGTLEHETRYRQLGLPLEDGTQHWPVDSRYG